MLEALPSVPSPGPNSHRIAPPNTHYPLHHGLTQHLHQRAQHHPQLPECHKHSAAIWRAIAVAYIWTMGCLRCDCPTCQRVPERGRERERLEGAEHRRYVKSVQRRSIAAQEAPQHLETCSCLGPVSQVPSPKLSYESRSRPS